MGIEILQKMRAPRLHREACTGGRLLQLPEQILVDCGWFCPGGSALPLWVGNPGHESLTLIGAFP